jgi:acetolactate synthase-like protein
LGWLCGGLGLCHYLTQSLLLDYHKAAIGLGARGLLLSRENEDQIVKVLQDGQQQCRDGHPVVVNILIGRTDFREGAISV